MLAIIRNFRTSSKINRRMKTLFLIVISVLTFSACTKQDSAAVQPDRARKMAGTYQIDQLTFQTGSEPAISIPLPLQLNGQPALAASINITRKSENVVDQTVAFVLNKAAFPADIDPGLLKDESYNVENLEIRDNGAGYDLYVNGDKLARFDDNTYSVDRTITDPNTGKTYRVGLRAKK